MVDRLKETVKKLSDDQKLIILILGAKEKEPVPSRTHLEFYLFLLKRLLGKYDPLKQ